MTTAPICFIDTETDGVHPGRKPWEIALIRRDQLGDHARTFFIEIDLATADPFGLKIGRFWDRHPMGRYLSSKRAKRPQPNDREPDGEKSAWYVTGRDAAETVVRLTYGSHLVGVEVGYGAEVLATLLRQHGMTPAWHYHLVDVEALAVGYLHGRRGPIFDGIDPVIPTPQVGPPWKSDELSRAVGVEPPSEDERHTALGDCRWAARLFDAITGTVKPEDDK